jgi:aromatic ring-opening dioxygenase catalytic subunit (LigB family)
MAIGLIKDCIHEKIVMLTSQGAINHALDFIDKTHNQIKEEFNEDMEQVIEQDKVQSDAINDAIERNNLEEEIESYDTTAVSDGKSSFSTTSTLTSPEELGREIRIRAVRMF